MDMFDSSFSQSGALNELTARHIFEIMPEQGPVMVIMDSEGNCWPSDSERFSALNISESYLKDLRDKIDDGDEPVVTQIDDFSIVAAQLCTERTNCGYVILALPRYSPESTLINIDLIEMLLNQVSLIARLLEKNNLLYELQMKNHVSYVPDEVSLN